MFLPSIPGYPEEHRIYFRRLSQTTQTDVLLGNLDLTGTGKVVLHPLTVQDRIRELNLKARMFTDTMLAIQATTGPSPRHGPMPGPRSLQCSPWGSPRILSPVDVRHILSSRSSENLVMLGLGSPAPSPVKRRWTRRSLRRQRSPVAQSAQRVSQQEEAEKLLRDTEDELRLRLEAITHRQRVMAASEAKSLVALLHSNDEILLERTLITIANCGTFAGNQALVPSLTILAREHKTCSVSYNVKFYVTNHTGQALVPNLTILARKHKTCSVSYNVKFYVTNHTGQALVPNLTILTREHKTCSVSSNMKFYVTNHTGQALVPNLTILTREHKTCSVSSNMKFYVTNHTGQALVPNLTILTREHKTSSVSSNMKFYITNHTGQALVPSLTILAREHKTCSVSYNVKFYVTHHTGRALVPNLTILARKHKTCSL
ncbi:DBD domain binding [Homalodisca vitripennis]|nr:DBD domain binding [Homalodisca vitripennis]